MLKSNSRYATLVVPDNHIESGGEYNPMWLLKLLFMSPRPAEAVSSKQADEWRRALDSYGEIKSTKPVPKGMCHPSQIGVQAQAGWER